MGFFDIFEQNGQKNRIPHEILHQKMYGLEFELFVGSKTITKRNSISL